MDLKGRVQYIELEMGFWGIVDDEGRQWYPINLPESMQKEGFLINTKAEEDPGFISSQMWGTPVRLLF